MRDIYICDSEKDFCAKIKDICTRWLLSRNSGSGIGYCGTEPEELIIIAEGISCRSVFVLEAGAALRTVSDKVRGLKVAEYILVSVKSLADLTEYLSPSVLPSGFIIKPPEDAAVERLLDEVEDDLKNAGKTGGGSFIFRTKSREYSVSLENIIYFESREKKMAVRTRTQEFLFYGSFGEIEKQLDENFVRVHKSFMINRLHAAEVNKTENYILMDDGTKVFYSRTYRDNAVLTEV